MSSRSDIRRIGAIMRHGGADGSLVAWVEAELERVDFLAPAPGCLSILVDDLTGRERQLIVAALLTVALDGPKVQDEGLDAAVRLGRELGFDVPGVERLLREVSGWSMAQARELAVRGLPSSTSPATLAEARRAPRHPEVPEPVDAPTDDGASATHGGAGPSSLLLDEIQFELPDLTESGQETTGTGDVTDPVVFPARPDPTASKFPTDRIDALAEAARAHEAPSEPAPDTDALGEDPPTVEMSPDAVRRMLRHKAREREVLTTPPRFSALGNVLDEPPADAPPDEVEDEDEDEGPTDIALSPVALIDRGIQELPQIDWGEGDAFTVNDFTLSERIASEQFGEDPEASKPTRFTRVPREVQRMLAATAEPDEEDPEQWEPIVEDPGVAEVPHDVVPLGRREPTEEIPDDPSETQSRDDEFGEPLSLDPEEPPIGFGETMDLDPDAAPVGFGETMDLDPDEDIGDGPSLPGPSIDELQLDADFLEPPPGDGWAKHDAHTTAELLDLELDEAPVGALDRALRTTAPLPVRPDPSHDLHTGEALKAAPFDGAPELSLDPDEPELSLDPDTGDRMAVARSRAVPWAPPNDPSQLPSALPTVDDDEDEEDEIQPLEQGLAAYWAPQPLQFPTAGEGGDGLTGELAIVDPGDVQGGLTGELKVLHAGDMQEGLTGELKLIDPGQAAALGGLLELDYDDEQGGLTSELQPVPMEEEPPKRRPRRQRRGSEGITQDLTLLVDGDPNRRKRED